MKKLLSFLLIVLIIKFVFVLPAGYSEVTFDSSDTFKSQAKSGADLSYNSTSNDGITYARPESEYAMFVYAPDGRCEVIDPKLKAQYNSVGWYDEPVMNVFALDGRSMVIKTSELEQYKNVGWYDEPVMVVYARDARELIIKKSELDLYKNVGWYDDVNEISSIMLAPDGSKIRVFSDYYVHYYSMGYRFVHNPSINPAKPMVALTFDDGPFIYTPDVVNCFKTYGGKATFFCVGTNVKRYPHIVKQAYDAGMEIGNHTYNHPNLAKISDYQIYTELNDTANEIYNAIGQYPTLLRPPYGSVDERVSSITGNPMILWSIDTLDWKTRNAQKTYDSVISGVRDGDIILMHDIHAPTLEAVKMIVPKLIEMGYQLVTVSELAMFKNTDLKPGTKYHRIR